MTLRQNAKYNSKRISLALLQKNMTVLSKVKVFPTIILAAVALLDTIFNRDKQRLQESKTLRGSKDQDQQDLAKQAMAIAAVIGSYASLKKDPALQESVRFTWKELFYGTDNLLSECCGIILDKAKMLGDELADFGISSALIDNYEQSIKMYGDSIDRPRVSITERKGAGQKVQQLFKEADRIFKEQIDPMMLLFKDSDPELYSQYKIRRAVIDPATHKTKVKGILVDDITGQPLRGVSVVVEGRDIEILTEADGSYEILVPSVKLVTLVFSKPGYSTIKTEAVVKKGRSTELRTSLKPL